MPTLVECKRFDDFRARREVVGQMLDYAANGKEYWSKDRLLSMASEAARKSGTELETAIRDLNPVNGRHRRMLFLSASVASSGRVRSGSSFSWRSRPTTYVVSQTF